MTEEEILRKKLDSLNENSHYGIMIDTEITDIVRRHIKRLEEKEMNATSTEEFKDIIAIDFELQTFPNPDVQDKFIVSATNRDDIFAFVFEGPNIVDTCRKTGLFAGWEKDQRIKFLEEEIGRWKKEAADCLRLRDEAQKEACKLKKENEKLTIEKVMLKEENENLEKVSKEWEKEAVTCSVLRNKAKKEFSMEIKAYERVVRENEKLKKELDLEKAANEAQHKFIREYAGKSTEVQFNYAIDDAKEVSYVIVDKKEYNKNFEKWANAQVEQDCNKNTRADILDQAKKCVCGQREQDYGTPESNFQLIADLWNGYLGEKTDNPVISVTPVDVSMMMALMKIARIRNGGGSGDSFVDLAGYAACGGEIWHGQKAKDQN